MVKNKAHLEAIIDFGESDSIGQDLNEIVKDLCCLREDILRHLKESRRGEILVSGTKIVLVGKPNSGKSSFLNAVSQRKAALVSCNPGTTRDVIRVCVDVAGFPVVFSDTAGIRESTENMDEIEKEGIGLSLFELKENCDIVLLVVDVSIESPELVSSWMSAFGIPLEKCGLILNKIDLVPQFNIESWTHQLYPMLGIFPVCAKEYPFEGLCDFLSVLKDNISREWSCEAGVSTLITKSRHVCHLVVCAEHLDSCLDHLRAADRYEDGMVFASEELGHALGSFGRITGKIGSEEVFDAIFSSFCVGK